MSDALKPCPNPWCEAQEREGDFSPQLRLHHHGNYRVVCSSCILEGPLRQTKEAAIAAWNTRTPSLHREPIEADREAANAIRRAMYDGDWGIDADAHDWRADHPLLQFIAAHRLAFSTPAASDAEGMRETFNYLCKWVERGLFDKHHTAEEALKCIAYHPGMPWMEGRWDVDHKPYAVEFYKAFPKAAATPSTEGRKGEDQVDG